MFHDLGTRSLKLTVASTVLLVAGSACGKPRAIGDANAVIVVVPDDQWAVVSDDIERALEPRAFTVRDERIFRVAHVDPSGPYWGDSRQFRQLIIIGEPGEEWVAQVLRQARQQPADLPAVVETRDVWARGQRVVALVLPPGSSADAARPLLDQVAQSMLEDYHTFVHQRMYASGADTQREGALMREAGFSLLLPTVYRQEQPDAQTYLFINDQPDPSQLQRVVTVTWRPAAEVAFAPEGIKSWREEVAQTYYEPPQLTERIEPTPGDEHSVHLHGVWESPPGAWPAGGPFLTRAQVCPDGRTFLLDAWVYAPGREKYEFVVQVNTILDSFRCAAPPQN